MKVKLMGIKRLDFTPKGEKDAIMGTYLFLAYKAPHVEGLECMKKFISDEDSFVILINLLDFVGEEIDLQLGFNNTVVAISA